MSTMSDVITAVHKKMEEDKKHKMFKNDPRLNVIPKDVFEERMEKVFHLLWETLSKSFGPYGAPTIICNYPHKHVTKDGFTIMKNLSMDASETLVDQSIADLVSDICGRLNYTVGDGTTTAIIATNSIYKAYQKYKKALDNLFVLPRDVIKFYDGIKRKLKLEFMDKVKPINSSDKDELASNIENVVYISSNGDTDITERITDFYKELGNPAISSTLSPDGITRSININGYSFELMLLDQIYINNDAKTMELREADVIIFSVKVTKAIYDNILKPLNFESFSRGRHLIVCAPNYDETTLLQTIRQELKAEYKSKGDVNMVLTSFRSFREDQRKLLSDFAVLMDTDILDRPLVSNILDKLSAGMQIFQVFNIDDRKINGVTCRAVANDLSKSSSYIYGVDEDSVRKHDMKPINEFEGLELLANAIRLGYTGECSLGLHKSLFSHLYYNDSLYNAQLAYAKNELDEVEKKYQRLGTFNIEVSQAQKRYHALTLKTGIIEVGASSELAQGLLKDAVDDAIKAAESAFNNGVVLGCNVTLLRIIYDILGRLSQKEDKPEKKINEILLNILFKGFIDVYKTVLTNAFEDKDFYLKDFVIPYSLNSNVTPHITVGEYDDKYFFNLDGLFKLIDKTIFENGYNRMQAQKIFDDPEILCKALQLYFKEMINERSTLSNESDKKVIMKLEDYRIGFFDMVIYYSILSESVFDITKLSYSDDIINSAQTDIEILNATVDLMSLLITGNQMLVTQKHNF